MILGDRYICIFFIANVTFITFVCGVSFQFLLGFIVFVFVVYCCCGFTVTRCLIVIMLAVVDAGTLDCIAIVIDSEYIEFPINLCSD